MQMKELNGISDVDTQEIKNVIHTTAPELSAAVDQSYFDDKINEWFEKSKEHIINTPEQKHRFDQFKLDPRTTLGEGERFCEDGELNDLIAKETAHNRELYKKLNAENNPQEPRPPSSRPSLAGLFRKNNTEKQFNQKAKTKFINQFEQHTEKLKNLTIDLSISMGIVGEARQQFELQLVKTQKALGMTNLENTDLNTLIFGKPNNLEQQNLAIAAKQLFAAEQMQQTFLEDALTASNDGILEVSSENKVSDFTNLLDEIDTAIAARNLAMLTNTLEPQMVPQNKKASSSVDDVISSKKETSDINVNKDDDTEFMESIKEAMDRLVNAILRRSSDGPAATPMP
jgi:hypothetical protein